MNITYSHPIPQKKVVTYNGEIAVKTYLFAALIICINLIALL